MRLLVAVRVTIVAGCPTRTDVIVELGICPLHDDVNHQTERQQNHRHEEQIEEFLGFAAGLLLLQSILLDGSPAVSFLIATCGVYNVLFNGEAFELGELIKQ